jgi:hypothetical protein
MSRMELRMRVDNKREHVILELWMDGKALGHILLDPSTAEQHIHDLGKARAALSEPVIPSLEIHSRLEAVIDPGWVIPAERLPQGKVLCLRHPGFGWLSFVLPDKEAAAIAEWLTRDLPLQPPSE